MAVLLTLLRKNALLKRRAYCSTCLEIAFPLFFVTLFVLMKGVTDVVNVRSGWSLENQKQCQYPVPEDGFGLTCTYPYTAFVTDTTSFSLLGQNLNGLWAGHDTAKMFLATSSGKERERQALDDFVEWMATVGPGTGPVPAFRDMVYIYGNATVEELENYVTSGTYGDPGFTEGEPECAMALVFDEMDFAGFNFTYTLRLNYTGQAFFEVPSTSFVDTYTTQRNLYWFSYSENVEYIESGFITVQTLVDAWIISTVGDVPFQDDIYQPFDPKWVPFPVEQYNWDEFFFYTAEVFPLLFTLAYLYPVARILAGLVRERETRVTEMLKIMGVAEMWIVISWYITYGVIFFILALVITLYSRILLPSSTEAAGGFSLIVFFVFFFYGMSITAFSFAVSTGFWRARTASYVGVIFYFMAFFIYYGVNSPDVDPKPFLVLLFPQVAFSLTIQTIAQLEGSSVGASSLTLNEPVAAFTIAQGLGFLLFDFILWTWLGSYLSAVLPREFGQRRSILFFLKRSYWREWHEFYFGDGSILQKFRKRNDSSSKATVDTEVTSMNPTFSGRWDDNVNIEARPAVEMRRPGIQVRHLCKVFHTPSGEKVAIKDLSLDMYEGEILALLGHNGAGKTTLLSTLSGQTSISGGDALIRGFSIRTGMSQIRRSLGFCPQHDVLYPTLTVKEHLWFYGKLKGIHGAALTEAIQTSIANVGLTEKTDVQSSALSGGMKRKLSVAIALLGDSKIVFVDEPTSGVDPWSRRSIWQVLQNHREGRVIVLTTHFMDEADLLGDRIAILAEGELRCLGSSLFLKRKFGAGYMLTMVKTKTNNEDVDDIKDVVFRHVPSAELSSNVGTEIAFQLPTNEAPKFAALFRELDSLKGKLPIDEYGVSVTTLEEVFLKVARADDQRGGPDGAREDVEEMGEEDIDAIKKKVKELAANAPMAEGVSGVKVGMEGSVTFRKHFYALLQKRVQYSRRDFRSFCCSIIMPVVLFAAGLTVLKVVPFVRPQPMYDLNPKTGWNPAFADQQEVLPFIELAFTGETTTRLGNQSYFPTFAINKRDLEPYNDTEETIIFERPYIDGLPTSGVCQVQDCSVNPSAVVGTALLNLAEEMIDHPYDVNGASLYTAAVLKPVLAELPYGCLIAEFEFTETALQLSYSQEACVNGPSECAMLETVFQGAQTCLPIGCLDNIIESNAIEEIIGIGQAGSDGETGLTPEEEQEVLQELLDNTLVLTCDSGPLCNTGPASLFDQSVCRASELNPCIIDTLTPYKVNNTDYSLYLANSSDVDFCDPSRGGDGAGTSAPTAAPTMLFNSSADALCYTSTIPQFVTSRLGQIFINASEGNAVFELNFNASASVNNLANVTCLDGGPCTMTVLEGQNASACVVDSCVDDPIASIASIDAFLPGFAGAMANGTGALCEDANLLCDAIVDLAALEDLDQVQLDAAALNLTVFNLFGVRLNETLLDQLVNFNFTEAANDPDVALAIADFIVLVGSTNLTNITAVVGELGETFNLEDILANNGQDLTEILNNPELQAQLASVVGDLYNLENELVNCTDPADSCLLAEVQLPPGSLCIPMGCREDFGSGATFAYVPALGQVTSFEEVPVFECDDNGCNDACRAGGNCEAEDLEPLLFDTDTAIFRNGTDTWCPPPPLRFSFLGMVNSTTRHGAPILANAIHNALLRLKGVETGTIPLDAEPMIKTFSQPLPLTASLQTIISGFLAFTAALFALIAFAFVPAAVASYVVQERESTANVKQSQFISGVGVVPYWLSMYAFDMLNYMVPMFGALFLILAFDIRTYIDNGVFGAVFLLLYGYGLAVIPFAYLTSNFFKNHTTALIMTLFLNLLTGLVLMITSFVLDSLDREYLNEVNADLKAFYRIFPGFCLGDSLIQLSIIKVLSGFVGPSYELPSPYDRSVAGASLIYLYVEAVIFFLAVLAIEIVYAYPALQSAIPSFRKSRRLHLPKKMPDAEDEDVRAEDERVKSIEAKSDTVMLKNLTKMYKSGKLAVNHINLGIRDGECFALLGINGAGKTTTLEMLTGKLAATRGTASVGGFNVGTELRDARRLIGYCPQFDALLDLLTVREHLQLFGRIKGLTGYALEESVQRLMLTLSLKPFEKKLAKSLSGGTKRKLSVAIALIGSPRVIFLDEPTTGVDPVSKRFLWTVLDEVREGTITGRRTTLILTSHSMEEVEALATRIGILVGGRFRTMGSSQHLKNRFGKGLLVDVTLAPPVPQEVYSLRDSVDLPETLTYEEIENGVLKVLGDDDRVNLILSKDDSAWALNTTLEEEGLLSRESLIEWWLIEKSFEDLLDFMVDRFVDVKVVERHDTQVRFSLAVKDVPGAFEALETNKLKLNLTDYSISQVTLEQIFNLFASQQEQETGRARGVVGFDT